MVTVVKLVVSGDCSGLCDYYFGVCVVTGVTVSCVVVVKGRMMTVW